MQMLLWEAPPVKTLAEPENKPDLMESVISGRKCAALLENAGRESSFMRMFAEESASDFSTRYAATWNLTATKFGRWYILLQYSERPTNVTACSTLGYWPTPQAFDSKEFQRSTPPDLSKAGHRNLRAEIHLWPTPNTMDTLPPRSPDAMRHQFTTARKGRTAPGNLREAIHPELHPLALWNTPTVNNHKNMTFPDAETDRDSLIGDLIQIGAATGYLNPSWEELLMGLPPGYLDLTRLNTFRASPPVRAAISIHMSRRAQRRKRANTRKSKSKPWVTVSYGSKLRR